MAGFNIHLAVEKRFIEKNNIIKNKQEFYKGILAPDLATNKQESHYTSLIDKSNLPLHLSKKVELYNYLRNNQIDTDYDKGYFIHLFTDFIFFNHFLPKEIITTISFDEFLTRLYNAYDLTNTHIEEKYNISYKNFVEKSVDNIGYINIPMLFTEQEIDSFIEDISNIDLELYKEKITKAKANVLP